jgi:excisionase family DNA binding protein
MALAGGRQRCITVTTAHHDDNRPLGRLMTISTLAAALGVAVRDVRRLVHERRIPYVMWGHLLRFDPTDVQAWIDKDRRHPGGPAHGR